MIFSLILVAVVLLIAPYYSGVPDEPFCSSICCALTFLAGLIGTVLSRRCRYPLFARTCSLGGKAEAAFAALFGIGLLSLLWRMLADHGIAFAGPMRRGLEILGTSLLLYILARRLTSSSRLYGYLLLLAVVLSSAFVAEKGFGEYLIHRRFGPVDWRIFATSTPDFLAGYLVILIPVTLALFLGIPWSRQKRTLIPGLLTFLLLIIVAMQAFILLRTQSRFALVSLAVGLLVFGLALWKSHRAGMRLERSSRIRLQAIVLIFIVFAALFARPVIARLRHTGASDNSTAFRLYTWRGAVIMAERHPVLGTGVGSWVDFYPRYAVTGFTRLAHNSYLQMVDECGLPGLIALLAVLGFVGCSLWGGLRDAAGEEEPKPAAVAMQELLVYIAPDDDRLVSAGLLGGLVAGVVQNFIDSDWYVFFLGVTFWALAGIAVGLRERQSVDTSAPSVARRWPAFTVGILSAVFMTDMLAQAGAAWYSAQAVVALQSGSSSSVSIAEQDYANAASWNPLSGTYPSDLGYDIFLQREERIPDAVQSLRTAVKLEPTDLNESFLATALNAEQDYPAALEALHTGLAADPQSIETRLTLAQMLPPPESTMYLRQVTQLEDSPVGRVRAIGNVVEYQFAIADSGVADADEGAGNKAGAISYYQRAATVLEEYADEGGTSDIQRQAMMGDRPNPALDAQMRSLYTHVMQQLVALSPPDRQVFLKSQTAIYEAKFANVFARSSQPGTL